MWEKLARAYQLSSSVLSRHNDDNAVVYPPVDFCISPIATRVPEAVVSPPKNYQKENVFLVLDTHLFVKA